MVAAMTSWQDVALALIAAVPAWIAAIAGLLNRRSLQVPSGGTIGQKVEHGHDLAAVSVYQNQAIASKVGVATQLSPDMEAAAEAAKVKVNGEPGA